MGKGVLMKIDLFVNDMLTQYRSYAKTKTITNIDIELVRKIYRPEHTYVLRGEITLHPKCRELLDIFTEKNYILCTESDNPSALIGYQGETPYISFSYDDLLYFLMLFLACSVFKYVLTPYLPIQVSRILF